MQLSVIIVNYNVKHFLEQCLYSVRSASKRLQAEVIVVDNRSEDNSLTYLQPLFPDVQFLANQENIGFSKACNQGLKLSTGNYVLFLNPDTIVPEDCFVKCIEFFESHPDAGAMGIKMLDGAGRFLKESKRSFPSPSAALYKLFGLSKIFPRSKIFSKYHLGNLDSDQTHEIDVLAGAFMMAKKEVLDKTGGFDETFFMYGEDVDLSYRIQKAGYKNYYFAGSSIIHFKGESTRKGSLNYIRMFYNAMSIFVRKQYGGSRARLFNFLIHSAIWFRAVMTAIANFIRQIGLPIVDVGLTLLSFWLVKNVWNKYVRPDVQYDNRLLWIFFPILTVAYLIIAYYAGLYDRYYKRPRLIRSALVATVVLLAGYSLLPEQYRFSRAIVVLGSLLSFVLIALLRWILVKAGVLKSQQQRNEELNTVIVGTPAEYENALHVMKEAGYAERVIGRVSVSENDTTGMSYWKNLKQLYKNIGFSEIIFCIGNLSFREIIEIVPQLPGSVKLKFHTDKSRSIVGSDSKDTSGEALSVENGFVLSDPYHRRMKRLTDVVVALIALITFPIHLFLIKKPFHFFTNCFAVLFGKKTWVGYAQGEKPFPPLRPGVLACNGAPLSEHNELPEESLKKMNYWYAHDYEAINDLRLLWRRYKQLGM
ncbi:MAG TPA: glycosyltransferase [Chitinophagaceae bacterium]|nr:glycosyltransferase [Chitinophagaceae bacterium]